MGLILINNFFKFCQVYSGRLPVAPAKKKDLLSLVDAGMLPEDECRHYYESLPTSAAVHETLPESDVDDIDD